MFRKILLAVLLSAGSVGVSQAQYVYPNYSRTYVYGYQPYNVGRPYAYYSSSQSPYPDNGYDAYGPHRYSGAYYPGYAPYTGYGYQYNYVNPSAATGAAIGSAVGTVLGGR